MFLFFGPLGLWAIIASLLWRLLDSIFFGSSPLLPSGAWPALQFVRPDWLLAVLPRESEMQVPPYIPIQPPARCAAVPG